MNCPYCAEQIQDAAILCRFCGAEKEGEAWSPPARHAPLAPAPAPPAKPAGQFTMHFTAVCCVVSGIFELINLSDAVPLFGAMRSGAPAIAYHLLYAALFFAMGVGMWGGWRWGLRVILGTVALYTLEKGIYLMDSQLLSAQAADLTRKYQGLVSKSTVMESIKLTTYFSLTCWWAFGAYVFFRREYFHQHDPVTSTQAEKAAVDADGTAPVGEIVPLEAEPATEPPKDAD